MHNVSRPGEPWKRGLDLATARTTSLNAQFLKSLRKELAWTQTDLAINAGLSVRVVAKAEAGEPVSQGTVRALVEAFQHAGKQLAAGDLVSSPEMLVRQFLHNYARYRADCVEHSRHFISPDIVALVDGDPSSNPLAGEYRGIEAFASFFRKFFTIFVHDGGTLSDAPEIRCVGNEAFAWGHEAIRVPQAEPQSGSFVMLRMRFDGGVMTYFEKRYEAGHVMLQLDEWVCRFPDAAWVKQVSHSDLSSKDALDPPQSLAPPAN